MIDRDPLRYPIRTMRAWKAEAEAQQAGTRFAAMARDTSGAAVPIVYVPVDRQFRASPDKERVVSPLMSGLD